MNYLKRSILLKVKKIWIDIEEPKTAIMFYPLIQRFQDIKNLELLITARDYDSTFNILNDHSIVYKKVGEHGGAKLESKLLAYINRLNDLFPIVKRFSPDHFITFSSVEGARISYGLGLPSIGFNDEPRNQHVCKLIFPFLDKIIVPKCIPKNWYIKLHADPHKLIQYNGIDEIAWLTGYTPNEDILNEFNLMKGNYIIIRSEPSFASYFTKKLKEEETKIAEFFPKIYQNFPNYHYFLLIRTDKQYNYLKRNLGNYLKKPNINLTKYLPHLVDLCFFSALIISGGGTIVRESSLLNVPSIEFFPGETAPQEKFLIQEGFPLNHVKDDDEIVETAIDLLDDKNFKDRFDLSYRRKIKKYENPNEICYKYVLKKLEI
jgi:uncharacterized protein